MIKSLSVNICIILMIALISPNGILINKDYLAEAIYDNPDENVQSKFQSNSWINHNPIVITSDLDFIDMGFNGSGSQNDPFVITRLNISSSEMNLIEISNINSHFIIENNVLNGLTREKSGIVILNSNFGLVKNNSIINTYNGIELYYTNQSSIIANRFLNVISSNLLISSSEDIEVISNTFETTLLLTSFAIDIRDSIKISIIKSEIQGMSSGIAIQDAIYNIDLKMHYVAENFIDVKSTGMLIYTSQYSTIIQNQIIAQKTGLRIRSSFLNISKNTIKNANNYGIEFSSTIDNPSSNNVIYGNNFINNSNSQSTSQGKDLGENNHFEYNYWSDWISPDDNNDNIVDIPYSIDTLSNDENKDLYPRTNMSNPIPVANNVITVPVNTSTMVTTSPTTSNTSKTTNLSSEMTKTDLLVWEPAKLGIFVVILGLLTVLAIFLKRKQF